MDATTVSSGQCRPCLKRGKGVFNEVRKKESKQ